MPKDIPGYEGIYKISDSGEVFFLKKGKWTKRKTTVWKGYVRVLLTKDGQQKTFSVHRLVLETFIGPCPSGMECRHWPDPNKTNLRVSNLRWGTRKENTNDKDVQGLIARGNKHGASKLSWKSVHKIRELYASGHRQKEIAARFHVHNVTIWAIVHGKHWKSEYKL